MKLAKQRNNNAARARNVRGKKRGKGKKRMGESENNFEGNADVTELMEDNPEQSGLRKIHAKIQREMDDQAEAPVQKKARTDEGMEEPEVMKQEEPELSKKEEIQKKEYTEVATKEEESPDISKEEKIQKKDESEPGDEKVQMKAKSAMPKYNAHYFTLKGEPGSQAIYVRETVSSYDAVHDVVKNRELYSIDTRTLLAVASLCMKAKEMGKEKFDTEYVAEKPVCIKLVNEVEQ